MILPTTCSNFASVIDYRDKAPLAEVAGCKSNYFLIPVKIMTEDTTLFLLQGMLQNLDEKMARLEKLLSYTSPSLGKEGNTKNETDVPLDLTDEWIDGPDVMQKLHISQRTLATLRQNGTLAYSRIGHKFYYQKRDIDELLRNAYVMYRLSAHGKEEGGSHGRF